MLNEQQKKLLKSIVEDKFSIGAFSGMLFNKISENTTNYSHEDYAKLALDIRLELIELCEVSNGNKNDY